MNIYKKKHQHVTSGVNLRVIILSMQIFRATNAEIVSNHPSMRFLK